MCCISVTTTTVMSKACLYGSTFFVCPSKWDSLHMVMNVGILTTSSSSIHSVRMRGGTAPPPPTESDTGSGAVDKRLCFRMMVWLCAYYDFYDKKVRPFTHPCTRAHTTTTHTLLHTLTLSLLPLGNLPAAVQCHGWPALPLPS